MKKLLMNNRIRLITAVVVIIGLSGFVLSQGDMYLKIAKSIDIFGKVYKEVSFNYVEKINPEEFMISGINGMLSALDPYTVFIDEKRKDDIDLITDGKYGGIGVSIGIRNDRVTIIDLIEGYSAQRQGLRIGDVIEKVNGVNIDKETFEDISSFVKGEPGTEVSLIVSREGGTEKLVFNLVREEVKIKNLLYSGFVPENSNNVYMKLTGFTRTAGEEIKNSLNELKNQKEITSIILDLRGNPGGLLDVAVDVCEKFLKKGDLIVSVMGRDSAGYKKYYSQEEPIAGKPKLIVLVDNYSASASEIVAGAIQDHDRGVILGTNTFGKGLVQTIIPLSYNTSLKITTAKYYTPSGRCIQKIDYSKSNKVLLSNHAKNSSNYYTDNKRRVFSSGGIIPDTIVSSGTESSLIKNLLAQGLFFKFANTYASGNSNTAYRKVGNDKLFNDFANYLEKENFNYTSEGEKRLNDMLLIASTEKFNRSIMDDLEKLKSQFREMKDSDVQSHKTEILMLLRDEISSRYEGTTGRIREALSADPQFLRALDVIKNEKLYHKLLSNK